MSDGGLQVVRYYHLYHPTEKLKGPHMRTGPTPQILSWRGFGEGGSAASPAPDVCARWQRRGWMETASAPSAGHSNSPATATSRRPLARRTRIHGRCSGKWNNCGRSDAGSVRANGAAELLSTCA